MGLRCRGRHRGIGITWTVVILVVLIGFGSLAVDVARLQLARTELQRATIAAARAGAAGLATDQATARSFAKTVALQNRFDLSQTLTLSNAEIAFINKNGKDGVRVTVSRSVPLILAGILGKSTSTVSASAAAIFTSGNSGWRYVVAARDSLTMSGNIRVDGYDSSVGDYGGANRSYGDLATGGWGTFSGNLHIDGTIYYTNGYSASGNLHGADFVRPLPQPIPTDVPGLPASYTNLGNFSGNNDITLSAGNYYATNWNISGNTDIAASGEITIYCSGNVNISGNIKASGGEPLKIKFVMLSSGSINISGNSKTYAVIQAPNSHVSISGNTNFYGSIVCKTASLSGNIKLHYDQALGTGEGGAGGVTLVE